MSTTLTAPAATTSVSTPAPNRTPNRRLAAVTLFALLAVAGGTTAAIVHVAPGPAGCTTDGVYRPGCQLVPGRADGWFVSPAIDVPPATHTEPPPSGTVPNGRVR